MARLIAVALAAANTVTGTFSTCSNHAARMKRIPKLTAQDRVELHASRKGEMKASQANHFLGPQTRACVYSAEALFSYSIDTERGQQHATFDAHASIAKDVFAFWSSP